ncbi:MAG: type I-F CRISPR-associated helicase Cas3f, partial [Azoarcus sp.]|nr:type I-F CRISPR-associated helicase Cas3f [Azoarcus sp.]
MDDAAPRPFDGLQSRAPLAAAIAWLIVSHHRLPTIPVYENDVQKWLGKRSSELDPARLQSLLAGISHDWNAQKYAAEQKDIEPYWQFKPELPVHSVQWQAEAGKIAARLLDLCGKTAKGQWLDNPYVMHLARLALMLADHHYSSLGPDSDKRLRGKGKGNLFANTYQGQPNQWLDEHLLGVAKNVARIAHALPGFERHLSHLARHRGLKKRTQEARFQWQNKAADMAETLRPQAQGAFIVNMASTGCGKTLANARIMNALADPQQGLRCTFALGLRTLTLQTGRAYRQDLRLDDDELAVLVGGSANRVLFEYHQQKAESAGAESRQDLIEEDSHVLFEGQVEFDDLLSRALPKEDARSRKLLSAPLLVCTIDHLTPATESQRGGRQIMPMLRLMSGGLVLDELDDFDLDDLPAITRLVHWAGLLGTRLLISSATLPPALVEGFYLAYGEGRKHFLRNRGVEAGQEQAPEIPCLWVDEFGAQTAFCAELSAFRVRHGDFVQKRVKKLSLDEPIRRGALLPLNLKNTEKDAVAREFAGAVRDAILRAHDDHHETCPHSGKQVSFGMVRMANIEPLFETALALFQSDDLPENVRIHLCVYHARFPLLLRSAIEERLDRALNRRKRDAVYDLPEIRAALDSHVESHQIFVVLASPVAEVGRDHDYDWAVVEPSSMRSLIQLAGRVQRHRQTPCPEKKPNILIFDTNLRHFYTTRGVDGQRLAAFVHPGFEKASAKKLDHPFRLRKHRLGKTAHCPVGLLQADEFEIVTARPRIQPRDVLQAKTSLVDLEHARLMDTMFPKADGLNAASAWIAPQAALTWALPQHQPFRADGAAREITLVFLPDEHDATRLI